jgi:site-specific recombinase XerD
VSGYEDYAGCVKPGSLRSFAVPRPGNLVKPVLTVEEIKRLYDACRKENTRNLRIRATAILSILLDSGIRASELCTLTIENVHLNPRDSYILVHGKGKKQREVGLGQKARIDLHRYIRQVRANALPTDAVFVSRNGEPLTRNGLDQILYRLKEAAGVCTPGGAHLFRHTYATMYLESGGDVYKLSRLMGHEHISTTQGYARNYQQRNARQGPSVLDNML